jgi:hypothetical protein
MRQLAEEEVRSLRGVLQQVAYTFAGQEYEQEIRGTPELLQRWTAGDWMAFFQRVAPVSQGWHDPQVVRERLHQVVAERDGLLAQVREQQDELAGLRALAVRSTPAATPANKAAAAPSTPTRPGFCWPEIPEKPPAANARLFSNWKRESLALALVASGLSFRVEAAELVGQFVGAKGRSGSIKRLFTDRLAKRGLIETEVVAIGTARAMLVWLTELGEEVCRAANIPVHENEYQRMLRLHGGEGQKEHGAATVVFAYHARKRGWQVEVLPEVEGKADPDAAAWREAGERVYVEVELGRGKTNKWKNLADLQGHVALCAINPEARAALVREVKQLRLPGRATDILSLVRQFTEEGSDHDLWVERWDG